MGSSWAERGVIEGDFQKKYFYSAKLFIWKKWIYGLKRKFTVKVIEMAKCVIFFPLCSLIIQLLPVHTRTEESPSDMPAYLPLRSTY